MFFVLLRSIFSGIFGSVSKLKANGIEDPIAFYSDEVKKLNGEYTSKKEVPISDAPVIKHLGYFPIKALISKLDVKPVIDLFWFTNTVF